MRRRVNEAAVHDFLGGLAKAEPEEKTAAPNASEIIQQAAYRLASRTRTNGTWDPPAVSGNAAIAEAVPLGLARIREQIRNNPQFRGALQTLVDLIIGNGVNAFAYPFEPVLELEAVRDADLIYAWESDLWFRRWADDPAQCDWEGKLSWWDMQRLAFSEAVGVGDALLIRCQRREPGKYIPFCLQLIERDQLDRSMDRAAEDGRNEIVNGLEFDARNRLVAAWIFDAHPDDHMYTRGGESRRVSADRIIHAYIPDRPSSDVGFTRFAANASVSRDRHWLVGSELTKSAIGALITLVHYSSAYGRGKGISLDGDGVIHESSETPDVRLAQGGVSVQVPEKDRVEMFAPQTPGQQLPGFVDLLDHDAAAGVGLSHLRYTGRWQKLSYTAGRGAQLDDEMHCAPLKEWWGRSVVLPVRRTVNAQMAVIPYRGRDRFSSLPAAEFLSDELRFQEYLVIGPGREYLQPDAETEAAMAKMRACLSTLIIEAGKMGRHWLDLLLQRRQVDYIAKRLGVVLDFSKGQGGERKTTSEESETEEEKQEARE